MEKQHICRTFQPATGRSMRATAATMTPDAPIAPAAAMTIFVATAVFLECIQRTLQCSHDDHRFGKNNAKRGGSRP
jgi:hypothetical protein